MKLNLLDRLVLSTAVLPTEGSFTDLILAKEIKERVSITGEEITLYKIVSSDNSVTWNQEGVDASFEFNFTEAETTLIKESLEKKNTEKKATNEMLHLYELFK